MRGFTARSPPIHLEATTQVSQPAVTWVQGSTAVTQPAWALSDMVVGEVNKLLPVLELWGAKYSVLQY